MGDAAGSCWTRPQTASTFSEGSGSRLMPRDSLLQPSLQRSALARICASLHGPRLLERPTRLGAHCLQPFLNDTVESLPLHPSVTVRWLDRKKNGVCVVFLNAGEAGERLPLGKSVQFCAYLLFVGALAARLSDG